MFTRRRFLAESAAAIAAGLASSFPGRADALGDGDKFQVATVVYSGGNPRPRPTALRRMLWEVDKRTSPFIAELRKAARVEIVKP